MRVHFVSSQSLFISFTSAGQVLKQAWEVHPYYQNLPGEKIPKKLQSPSVFLELYLAVLYTLHVVGGCAMYMFIDIPGTVSSIGGNAALSGLVGERRQLQILPPLSAASFQPASLSMSHLVPSLATDIPPDTAAKSVTLCTDGHGTHV